MPPAAAGQCDTEYLAAGVNLAASRLHYGNLMTADTSILYACNNPGTDPNTCLTTRQAFSYSFAFDGETDGTDPNDGLMSVPIARPFQAVVALWQVALDQAYPDGGWQRRTHFYAALCGLFVGPDVSTHPWPYCCCCCIVCFAMSGTSCSGASVCLQ